jgi:hypothetical protein
LISKKEDGEGEQEDMSRHVMTGTQSGNERVVRVGPCSIIDDGEKFRMGRA